MFLNRRTAQHNQFVAICDLTDIQQGSRKSQIKQDVREAAQYASPLYAACCSPAPAPTRLTPAAPSVPCAMNIHDRQTDHGVVHINHVVT